VGTAAIDASVASIKATVGTNATDTIGAVALDLCKGDWAETAGANITCTYAVADIHLVKGSWTQSSGVSTTHLTGGLHYQKIAGDYSVSAPMITLLGAMGTFKGGGSELKLGGGPILAKGSKITSTAALLVKMGTSLKLG
jgi:type VI secretion system secreted protein VgrG